MKKVIIIKNLQEFYQKIHFMNWGTKVGMQYSIKYKDIFYSNSKQKHEQEIDEVLKLLDILNTRKRREKYSLLYDYACDYLDNEFQKNNFCHFVKNVCVNNQNNVKKRVNSCCTRNANNKLCKHFDNQNKSCKIKCLACKLYTCPYLITKGIKYTPNKISYLKYFLSFRQKRICRYYFFTDKEQIIDKWMKFYVL